MRLTVFIVMKYVECSAYMSWTFLSKWLTMFCILHVYLSMHHQAGICNAAAIYAEEIVQNGSVIVEHLHSLLGFGTLHCVVMCKAGINVETEKMFN